MQALSPMWIKVMAFKKVDLWAAPYISYIHIYIYIQYIYIYTVYIYIYLSALAVPVTVLAETSTFCCCTALSWRFPHQSLCADWHGICLTPRVGGWAPKASGLSLDSYRIN